MNRKLIEVDSAYAIKISNKYEFLQLIPLDDIPDMINDLYQIETEIEACSSNKYKRRVLKILDKVYRKIDSKLTAIIDDNLEIFFNDFFDSQRRCKPYDTNKPSYRRLQEIILFLNEQMDFYYAARPFDKPFLLKDEFVKGDAQKRYDLLFEHYKPKTTNKKPKYKK